MTVYKTQNPSADNPRSRPWYKHNFPLVYVVCRRQAFINQALNRKSVKCLEKQSATTMIHKHRAFRHPKKQHDNHT